MISPLDRKLLRDLWRIKSQVLAIGLVIGSGVAMYVLSLSCFHSLELTRSAYYDRYRFADVFASLKRAPRSLERDIASIPDVARVETRVVAGVTLDVAGLAEPAVGRLVSVPDHGRPLLNDLYLRRGRYLEPGSDDEVLLSEKFATIHGLQPGKTIGAVINGRRRELRVVGIALSPEYVYTIRPGELLPDDSRFAVMWMGRRGLATAFDMEGGFNDVALSLSARANEREVIDRLDRLLERYGGLGAITRELQISHWYLESELAQLRGMGRVIPIVFLAVAAFLLNVVLSRTVTLQREQIAALKALGYGNGAVAAHYVKWALAIAVLGSILGTLSGMRFGLWMTGMYTRFFNFPILLYRLLPGTAVEAVAISLVAATVGALGAVRQAAGLPPAEAMRPEPPARYRVGWIERIGLGRLISEPTRIILRNLQRRPWRAALSVIGIAAGGAMLIVGSFTLDAIDEVLDLLFNVGQRHDAMVSFVEPVSAGGLLASRRLPGVLDAEPFRAVPVRLRHEHRSRQLAITGLPSDARLNRIVADSGRPVTLPPEGLVLSSMLGRLLRVEAGDEIRVEVLEGARPVRHVPVAALVDDFMGLSAYMELSALHRLMREGPSVSGVYLQVDSSRLDTLYGRLKSMPAVAGVMLKRAAIESFQKTLGENIGIFRMFNILFAAIIAFGVVYNSARISLSERSRELATLRVIGFTRAEISYILLGELTVLTLVAVPLSMVLGYGLGSLTVQAYETELYRIPFIVARRTFAYTALTVVLSALVSGLVVRRRLDHLDLVSVLKTRE